MQSYKVAAFYKFASLPDLGPLKADLQGVCRRHQTLGTILLAPEGVNGTIAGLPEGVDHVVGWLRDRPPWYDLQVKVSFANEQLFYRMKVRVKQEIIPFGRALADDDPAGVHVDPRDWNALISDPDVLLLDARNDYEVEVGTFEGALDPKLSSFQCFIAYADERLAAKRDQKIAMFCTGGIRCEKASAYLRQRGFERVYQLRGGILKYLEDVDPQESVWRGECFVFDQRVSLDHDLKRGSYTVCYSCQQPLSAEDRASPLFEQGVCCPRCANTLSARKRARNEARQRQVTLAWQRGQRHIGRLSAIQGAADSENIV